MEPGGRAVMRPVLCWAVLLAGAVAHLAMAQPAAPQPQPTPAEYQAAIRQLAAGAADDAGRLAQLRMTLGQIEAQRDAALARVRELEAKVVPPAPAEPKGE